MKVNKIKDAYALKVIQPNVVLVKVGDTSMIAHAFGVSADSKESLIQKVVDSFGLKSEDVQVISVKEAQQLKKRVSDSGVRVRVF